MTDGYHASAILEIESKKDKETPVVYPDQVTYILNRSTLNGHAVAAAIMTRPMDKPTHIPDFGHDYCCQCPDPEMYGVLRHYGLEIVFREPITFDDVNGVYWLSDRRARVWIIGITKVERIAHKLERET